MYLRSIYSLFLVTSYSPSVCINVLILGDRNLPQLIEQKWKFSGYVIEQFGAKRLQEWLYPGA